VNDYEKCGKPLESGGACSLAKGHSFTGHAGQPGPSGTYLPSTEDTRREVEVTRAEIELKKAKADLEKAKVDEVPQAIGRRRDDGVLTRGILRRILNELKAIRRLNDGGHHASEALGCPRPRRTHRDFVSAREAAAALGVELVDLVELGKEAQEILDREKRAGISKPREREGRTFRVRRSPDCE